MNKNKIVKNLMIILLGVTLFVLTGCTASSNKVETENKGENKVENQIMKESNNSSINENNTNDINGTTDNTTKATNNVSSTDKNISQTFNEETVKKVWLEELKSESELQSEMPTKLLDYRVDSVKIVDFEEIKKNIDGIEEYYHGAKKSDIFATITYSVKPDASSKQYWLAGNGTDKGEWIENKLVNVWLKEQNGKYSVESSGTSW